MARLGTGQWAYIATPLGFYAGCLSMPAFVTPPAALDLAAAGGAALPSLPGWGLALLGVVVLLRLALAGALLAGALFGGWATGQWQRHVPTPAALARCFAGGWLLGCGSLLVPGGNDSLILLGLPLLWPHAWASVALMCPVIGMVLLAQRWRLQGRSQKPLQAEGKSQS